MYRFGSGSRGVSLIAALVFVALLAGTAYTLETGMGASPSQVAAGATNFSQYYMLPSGQIVDITKLPAGTDLSTLTAPLNNAPPATETRQCKPGDQYTVKSAKPGDTASTKKVEDKAHPCKDLTGDAKTQCEQAHPQCEVTYCDPDGKNCHKMLFNPGDKVFDTAINAESPKDVASKISPQELANTLMGMNKQDRDAILPSLGLNAQQSQGIADAFKEEANTLQGLISSEKKDANAVQSQLESLATQCGYAGDANDQTCKDYQQMKSRAQSQQEDIDAMQKRLDDLKASQASLSPQTCGQPGSALDTCIPPNGYSTPQAWCQSPGPEGGAASALCNKGGGDVPTPCQNGPAVNGKCPDTGTICSISCPAGQKHSQAACSCEPDPTDPRLKQTCPNGGTWPLCSNLDDLTKALKQQQNPFQKMLGELGKLFGGGGGAGSGSGGSGSGASAPQQPAQPCSTDPNMYAQQQQQYQQALQQYNYQQQQYNYQRQLNKYYGDNAPAPPMPLQPSACQPSSGQQCPAQPQQPPASSCTTGYWQPTYNGVCVTNWQCVGSNADLKAQLSCQPQVADVGQTLAMAFSCSSGVAQGKGFDTKGAQSGSATTTVANPPAGTNTASYALTCTDQGKTAGAQCSVQVNKPSIILVANPKSVRSGEISLIGWITTGMQSCVVSSPDQTDFTDRNSPNTSVNGTATTSPITKATQFLLHCQTLAGGTKDASSTVTTK